jgi:uncharacterized membrane protein
MYLVLSKIFINFLVYSFMGYIMEIIICSIQYKKLVNRGFLFGPICPIYGVGALLICWGLGRYESNPVLVFVLGMIITSTVEYYTSYIFEKIFHNKWWDYSDRPDNVNGRICLGNCLGFGVGSILIIFLFQPTILYFMSFIPDKFILIFATIAFVLLIADLISSSIIAYNLRTRIIVAEELKRDKIIMLPKMLEKKYRDQIAKIRFKTNRIMKNYPNMALDLKKELEVVKKMVIDFKKEKSKINIKKKKKNVKKM